MKVVSFVAIKGGVGKTTLTYNFAGYLAQQDKKVLLLDLDHQCNLTNCFEEPKNETSIAAVFASQGDKNAKVDIDHVDKNIDLISGNYQLDKIETSLETADMKSLILYRWFMTSDHDWNQYDYILIDCHPDFSISTKNAVVISDMVISPLIPSEFSLMGKTNLVARFDLLSKQILNPATQESIVDAKLTFVGNMIRHNTAASRELIELGNKENDIIAMIPQKELFNKSTIQHRDIFKMMEDKKLHNQQRDFYEDISSIFESIKNKIDKC